MFSHFIHLLEGLGLACVALGVIVGWVFHIAYHRARFGKGAHKKAQA